MAFLECALNIATAFTQTLIKQGFLSIVSKEGIVIRKIHNLKS